MLGKAEETKERRTRIYNDHPYKFLICKEFVKHLAKIAPGAYRAKDFGRWVEIQNI
jgi:hypothetical protein